MRPRLRILVAGTFARCPGQGGATWAVLQYALGLRELGHDVVLVDPCEHRADIVGYFERVVTEGGLRGRAALIHPDRRATGLSYRSLATWTASADVLLNLAGVLTDEELGGPIGTRVYVDLDPAFTQLWETVEGIDMRFCGHHKFVTVGQAIGAPECTAPTCGIAWTPTLPPVVLSMWPEAANEPRHGITTVANWRSYGSITTGGVHYGQKAHALRELLGLPARLPRLRFDLALAIDPAERDDLAALHGNGWMLVDPLAVAGDPHSYRQFLATSTAEIGVAKSGYVASRCGWFSDRSASYLACGRPVVAQETGWSRYLPSGVGLLAFDTLEEAVDAVGEVVGDYGRHCKEARALATELFDARLVLSHLLDSVGR